jgi:molecular chaperone DnaK (HSP70)
MALDLDGILRVTATEKATGLSKEVAIENALAKLDAAQLEKSRKEVAALFASAPLDDGDAHASEDDDAGLATEEPSPDDCADLLARVTQARAKMDAADQSDTDRILAQLEAARDARDDAAVVKAIEELKDILFYLESE